MENTIQRLQKMVETLRAEIDEKDEIIEELTNYIDNLEAENTALREELNNE